MFTVEQIKAAHEKVKSGAEFPLYIQVIKAMGVKYYNAYVTDGHIDYHGDKDYVAKVPTKFDPLVIADRVDAEQFQSGLIAHQQGKTDFLTFIQLCASCGIEKWQVCMEKMTCTYYDKGGDAVLEERIPQ